MGVTGENADGLKLQHELSAVNRVTIRGEGGDAVDLDRNLARGRCSEASVAWQMVA